MNLVSLRIITADIVPLVAFYAAVTNLTPTWFTDDFAELVTPSGAGARAIVRAIG